MRWRTLIRAVGAGLALLGLAGCDDQHWVISRVDRAVVFDSSMVRLMAAGGGIPTEIYGAPWPGATVEEVADNLRMPANLPPDVRFRYLPPKSAPARSPEKLVLIFNGAAPPDPIVSCDLDAGEPVEPPAAVGFELFAVFCRGRGVAATWMAHGHMSAPRIEAGDWAGFQKLSRVFFAEIITDPSGRIER